MQIKSELVIVRLKVLTDFGIPSVKFYEGPDAYKRAKDYGEYCIHQLGCSRYEITERYRPAA